MLLLVGIAKADRALIGVGEDDWTDWRCDATRRVHVGIAKADRGQECDATRRVHGACRKAACRGGTRLFRRGTRLCQRRLAVLVFTNTD